MAPRAMRQLLLQELKSLLKKKVILCLCGTLQGKWETKMVCVFVCVCIVFNVATFYRLTLLAYIVIAFDARNTS